MLASVLAAAIGLAAPDAGAPAPQPVELFLSFTSPSAGCPTREAIEASVTRRLGSDPFLAGAARSLHVVGRKEGDAWLADLEFRDGLKVLGHQTLRSASADCAELEPVIVLTLSVVCGTSPTVPPPSEGDIEKQFSVIPEVAPPTAEKPEATESASAHILWAGAGVLVTAGAAPKVAFGGTVEGEAAWRSFSLGIQGRADLPVTKTLPVGQLETNLLYGALLPCGRLEQWSGCALIALGSQRASGSGYPRANTGTSLYAGLGLQARFDLPLSNDWKLRFHADLLAPLTRAIVRVQQEVVWQVPAVSFGLGAELLGSPP